MNTFERACVGAVLLACFAPASAADKHGQFYGLLRVRDLTPFGSLRLDMRPAHAVSIEKGTFAFEADIGYQNTWALSPPVEDYLTKQGKLGRHELGPADARAIRDLPGENYLVDLESTVVDLTVHYKMSERLSAYLIANAITYEGGFLDSTIEDFHQSFGFSSFGRSAASRDDVNIIYDLNSSQAEYFEAPTRGGLTDPTLGVRYAGLTLSDRWTLGLEAAVKVPVAGERTLLSTGRTDWGVQGAVQRRGGRHAVYADLAAVYYAGARQPAPQESQVIPTVILGYEYQWSSRTNIILQGYASTSAYTRETTHLHELTTEKYQLTLGMRHRRDSLLFSFGVTENFQNVNNTADIGFQLGFAFVPGLAKL
jgi:hypothetical protein